MCSTTPATSDAKITTNTCCGSLPVAGSVPRAVEDDVPRVVVVVAAIVVVADANVVVDAPVELVCVVVGPLVVGPFVVGPLVVGGGVGAAATVTVSHASVRSF
jgi:hypothetical protein